MIVFLRPFQFLIFISISINGKSDREIGGNLSDWAKYATQPFHTKHGLVRMHFCYNPVIDKAYYGMDYKSVYDHHGKWDQGAQPNYDTRTNSPSRR